MISTVPCRTIPCRSHSAPTSPSATQLALAAGKITRDTPDPAGGHIKHDPQTGEPTGELHERAQLILQKVAPEFNYLQLKDGIVFALNQCLERGVTTVHDIVRYAEPVRAYQEIYKEGRMHARVSILPRVIESMIETKSLTELGLITGFGNEWLRIGGVKMSIDGGITGRNACFHEPYENDEHNHGIIRIQQDELNHTVQVCHDAGLRCCVHAIGDKAFDMALDAYENAIEHSPRKDHRHRIEHMGNWLATPKLIQRMVRSGIVAIPNIAFAYYIGDAILDCVGERRLTKAFPFHTLLKNGVIIVRRLGFAGLLAGGSVARHRHRRVAQNALGRSLDTGGKNHGQPKRSPCTPPRRHGSASKKTTRAR